jgi:hypothetical protein
LALFLKVTDDYTDKERKIIQPHISEAKFVHEQLLNLVVPAQEFSVEQHAMTRDSTDRDPAPMSHDKVTYQNWPQQHDDSFDPPVDDIDTATSLVDIQVGGRGNLTNVASSKQSTRTEERQIGDEATVATTMTATKQTTDNATTETTTEANHDANVDNIQNNANDEQILQELVKVLNTMDKK